MDGGEKSRLCRCPTCLPAGQRGGVGAVRDVCKWLAGKRLEIAATARDFAAIARDFAAARQDFAEGSWFFAATVWEFTATVRDFAAAVREFSAVIQFFVGAREELAAALRESAGEAGNLAAPGRESAAHDRRRGTRMENNVPLLIGLRAIVRRNVQVSRVMLGVVRKNRLVLKIHREVFRGK